MHFVILHLTDIHLEGYDDVILKKSHEIARCVYDKARSADHLLIAVSGDIAWAGKAHQFAAGSDFLRSIEKYIRDEVPTLSISYAIAPGNHDCDFGDDQEARDAHLDTFAKAPDQGKIKTSGSIFESVISVEREFFKFRESFIASASADSRLWLPIDIDVAGVRIRINCLNVAWTSRLHDHPGNVTFPFKQFAALSSDAHLSIAVFHHPAHWLSQDVYREFRAFVRGANHFIFTGHEHAENAGTNVDTESGTSSFFEGNALQHHDARALTGTGFAVVAISVDEAANWEYQAYTFSPDGMYKPGTFATDAIQLTPRQAFINTPSFTSTLEESGIPLMHPRRGGQIRL